MILLVGNLCYSLEKRAELFLTLVTQAVGDRGFTIIYGYKRTGIQMVEKVSKKNKKCVSEFMWLSSGEDKEGLT